MKAQIPFILAILIVLSAVGLINSQYQARKVFAKVEAEQMKSRQLEIEKGQLQLKQSQLSQHATVEQKAAGTLNMVPITKADTEYLRTK